MIFLYILDFSSLTSPRIFCLFSFRLEIACLFSRSNHSYGFQKKTLVDFKIIQTHNCLSSAFIDRGFPSVVSVPNFKNWFWPGRYASHFMFCFFSFFSRIENFQLLIETCQKIRAVPISKFSIFLNSPHLKIDLFRLFSSPTRFLEFVPFCFRVLFMLYSVSVSLFLSSTPTHKTLNFISLFFLLVSRSHILMIISNIIH